MSLRLFYAIWPGVECRAALSEASRQLQHIGRGSFVAPRNLHLTLHFIGETERLNAALGALEAVRAAPFPLTFANLGRFPRGGGDILWAGVAPSPRLAALQAQLEQEVGRAGFPLGERSWRPHVTLARKGRLEAGAHFESLLPPCTMTADRICLLKSERDEGGVHYSTVAEKKLTG